MAQQQYPDYEWCLLDEVEPTETTTIEMTDDLRFRPTIATFPKGSTVTWTNPSFEHMLVIPQLDVDRSVAGGEETSLTIDRPGTFDYVCDIHPPKMLGRLVVTGPEEMATASVDQTIPLRDTAFQTLKAEVATGATVKWTNEDSFPHTITSAQFHDVADS